MLFFVHFYCLSIEDTVMSWNWNKKASSQKMP